MQHEIRNTIAKSIQVKQDLIKDEKIIQTVEKIVEEIIDTYKNGGKVFFAGNGGSAADCLHLSAELSGRFYFDRPPLSAEALNGNSSHITAVGNDYSFEEIYSRYIKAAGKKGDVLFGISTSGKSKNIIKAVKEANSIGISTVGLTGQSGGELRGFCKYLICVPSIDTPRIQESHILIGHIICELVEQKLFGENKS